MKKKMLFLISVVVLLALVSNAPATYCEWKGAEGGDWFTATNWSTGIVPNATGSTVEPFYKAGFKTGAGSVTSPGITAGVSVTTDQVTDGGAGGGRLTIDGGTMGVSQYFTMAASATEIGVLEMKSGTLSTGIWSTNAKLMIGQAGKGTLDMTGGTINVRAELSLADKYATLPASSEGLVNLLGGIIYASDLLMNGAVGGKSNIIITNGFLVLNNPVDLTGKIDGWIASGNIRTTIPGGSVLSAYDPDSSTTIVWAIPEPATICMLGLGLLGILGRKK